MDSETVFEIRPVFGMMVAGYITSTQTEDDGVVQYGLFPSREAAHQWAKLLEGTTFVSPVYEASWNRG